MPTRKLSCFTRFSRKTCESFPYLNAHNDFHKCALDLSQRKLSNCTENLNRSCQRPTTPHARLPLSVHSHTRPWTVSHQCSLCFQFCFLRSCLVPKLICIVNRDRCNSLVMAALILQNIWPRDSFWLFVPCSNNCCSIGILCKFKCNFLCNNNPTCELYYGVSYTTYYSATVGLEKKTFIQDKFGKRVVSNFDNRFLRVSECVSSSSDWSGFRNRLNKQQLFSDCVCIFLSFSYVCCTDHLKSYFVYDHHCKQKFIWSESSVRLLWPKGWFGIFVMYVMCCNMHVVVSESLNLNPLRCI